MSNEERIINYLEGQMSIDEALQFEKQVAESPELQSELASYKVIFGSLDEMSLEQPSVTLKSNFNHILENEIKKSKERGKVLSIGMWRNIAAVAAVLVIGILVGQNWTQKSIIDQQNSTIASEMKQEMNSASVTGRIEALQVSQKVDQPQDEILGTLIATLKHDESPNVRLAAAEVLDNYAEKEEVRAAFVSQLSTEKDPFVLIALITTLSDQKVEKAIDPLLDLTTAEEVAKFIKDEAHLGLIKIEKI